MGRTKGHCMEFMFLSLAHGGDGEIQEAEQAMMDDLRRPIMERVGEATTLKVVSETRQWYEEVWRSRGREGVKDTFFSCAGAVAAGFGWNKELLAGFYADMEKLAMADETLTIGEEAVLQDVRRFWELEA